MAHIPEKCSSDHYLLTAVLSFQFTNTYGFDHRSHRVFPWFYVVDIASKYLF